MEKILTEKQELFAQNLFEGMGVREAYIKAGYSNRSSLAIIDSHASHLAHNGKIIARVKELRESAVSPLVMSKQERMERLSEIARARLTDYQESGQDGGWINIGKESPNTAAIAEIVSTTKYDDNGASPTLITKVKLHNPMQAIDLLNKMERVYGEIPPVNVDNRQINFIVQSEDQAKEITQLVEGITERTKKLINGHNTNEES